MSPVASLVTTDRCSNVSMCLRISTKCFLFPGIVPLLYSVGNKTYYYYYYLVWATDDGTGNCCYLKSFPTDAIVKFDNKEREWSTHEQRHNNNDDIAYFYGASNATRDDTEFYHHGHGGQTSNTTRGELLRKEINLNIINGDFIFPQNYTVIKLLSGRPGFKGTLLTWSQTHKFNYSNLGTQIAFALKWM